MSNIIVTIPSHCELTIVRPNGETEIVNYTVATKGQIRTMRDKEFAIIKAATAKAGRGDVVSYRNVTKQADVTAEVEAGRKSDAAYYAYKAGHDAVANMAAGGEYHN